jgi:hypothetical protein
MHHQIIFFPKKWKNENSTQFSKAQFTLEMEGGVNTLQGYKISVVGQICFHGDKKTKKKLCSNYNLIHVVTILGVQV